MTLQDWAAIVEIVVGVAAIVSALVGLLGWFRRRRDALPEPPVFGFTEERKVDLDGVRWVKAWVQSTGERAYVHDVCCEQYIPSPLPPEKHPKVARVGELQSLPRELRSFSKRKLRHEEFVFKPQYLAPDEPVGFWVSCPLWIEKVELAVTMSVGRLGYKRRTFSTWLDAPDADALGGIEPVYFPA